MEEKLNSFPLVSIVLPTYNGCKYLRQSIESCLNQTYKNIELIVVDDGSTDATAEVVKSYQDKKIKYLRHEKNLGLPHALNTGFSKAKGEYLTWTSDDNYYTKDAIEVMTNFLNKKKDVGLVYADCYVIDEKGDVLRYHQVSSIKKLYVECSVWACFLYRRKVYEEVGEYNPQAKYFEDYEYWFRVREKFKIRRLNKCLYYIRKHKNRLTNYLINLPHKNGRELEDRLLEMKKRYISLAERHFLYAERCFREGDYSSAKRMAIKSLLLNPLNLDTWRLLIPLILNPSILRGIRKIKKAILKVKTYHGNREKK